jgi:hypothetical protein
MLDVLFPHKTIDGLGKLSPLFEPLEVGQVSILKADAAKRGEVAVRSHNFNHTPAFPWKQDIHVLRVDVERVLWTRSRPL